jgi:hypothetical protein
MKEIFLNFRGSASLVDVSVVGGSEPKAIPHFCSAPYGSEADVKVLFKASQYKNVHKKNLHTLFQAAIQPIKIRL